MSHVTDTFLLSALEPEQRVAILEILSSSDLTTILGYSATRADASRKIAQNEKLSAQVELTLSYESPF